MYKMMLERAKAAGLNLSEEQAKQFETYHSMLIDANAKFNLTRVSEDIAEAIDRNYLDCCMPFAGDFPSDVKTIADIGSGAGFPGIPISIYRPDIHVVMMDSLGKRVEFLKSVIDALGLNAEAVHIRAEDGARKGEYREAFDMATARAVASLNLLSEYLLPFVKVGGWMMALKGPTLEEELDQAQNALSILGGEFIREEKAVIPGRDWDHRLAYIKKVAATPEKYPRKAGKPEKKPL